MKDVDDPAILKQHIAGLLEKQPVWRCRPGQDPELFWNGYWFVKRSHAKRRVNEAKEQAAMVCQQLALFYSDRQDMRSCKAAEVCASNIRKTKSL